MPKTISGALATHLGLEVTSLATIWKVTREDTTAFFFTDHDKNIVFSGDTYLAAVGYNRTSIESRVGLAVDNLDVSGFLDSSAITETDLRAGLYDFADVRVSIVNWKDLSQGELKMRRGRFGEVKYSDDGTFSTELRGMSQAYSQRLVELYQPECRVDLGSAKCGIVLFPTEVARNTAYIVGDKVRASNPPPGSITEDYDDRVYTCTTAGTSAGTQPTYDTVVGNTTTDGTAVFTAEEAFTRAGVVSTVTDNRIFTFTFPNGADTRLVLDWFKFGAVDWDTGNNNNVFPMEVKDSFLSVTTGAITLAVDDTNTFSRASGSFVTDGFVAGRKIVTSGFTDGANNGTFTIQTVGVLTLDIVETTLVAESGTGDEVIQTHDYIELFLSMPFNIQVGDKFSMYAGCDKRLVTCRDKFDNIINMRAEPFIIGQDAYLKITRPGEGGAQPIGGSLSTTIGDLVQ